MSSLCNETTFIDLCLLPYLLHTLERLLLVLGLKVTFARGRLWHVTTSPTSKNKVNTSKKGKVSKNRKVTKNNGRKTDKKEEKSSGKRKVLQDSDEESEEDDYFCLMCCEAFDQSRAGEEWVQCIVCKKTISYKLYTLNVRKEMFCPIPAWIARVIAQTITIIIVTEWYYLVL